MSEVFINGETRVIKVTQEPTTAGLVSIQAQRDLYSEWKRWMVSSGGTKFEMAFRTIGGDTLTPTLKVGAYFFIQNQVYTADGGTGWRLEPYDADHEMEIYGNLYKEDITKPIYQKSTGGAYSVLTRLETSSLTQLAEMGDPQAVANAVWEHAQRTLTDISAADIASIQSKLDIIVGDIAEMHVKLDATTGGIESVDIKIDYITDELELIKAEQSLQATSGQIESLETLTFRILGFVQENFRVLDHDYKEIEIEGQTRYFLQGATVRVYDNATDCNNNTNPTGELSMVATYDAVGRCTGYRSRKVF